MTALKYKRKLIFYLKPYLSRKLNKKNTKKSYRCRYNTFLAKHLNRIKNIINIVIVR